MVKVKQWMWLILFLLSGCAKSPSPEVNNMCSLFKQYPRWYFAAQDVQRRWHVSIPIQMAIIHQESKFKGKAIPRRKKVFGILPGKRPSSAYGYSQVLNGTWLHYKKTNGGVFSSRNHFSDGVDFIGWYADMAHRQAHISRDDAYALYLAYHEGIGGYQRKTYMKKPWLISIANNVRTRANTYRAQLNACKHALPHHAWYQVW